MRLSIDALQPRPKYRRKKFAGARKAEFSDADARREDATRSRRLIRIAADLPKKRSQEAEALGRRLSYGDGPPPPTLASSAYFHAVREPLLDHIVRLAAMTKWHPVVFGVMLPARSYVALGKLKRFSARAALERLRQDLRRVGAHFAEGWLIATVHGEANEGKNGWNPHYHLVVGGLEMRRAIDRLRLKRKYKLIQDAPDLIRSAKAPPIRLRPIRSDELRYALSYLLPGFWPSHWSGEGTEGRNVRSSRRRLAPASEFEFLQWLDQQQLSDLVMLFHLRVGRKKLHINLPSRPYVKEGDL